MPKAFARSWSWPVGWAMSGSRRCWMAHLVRLDRPPGRFMGKVGLREGRRMKFRSEGVRVVPVARYAWALDVIRAGAAAGGWAVVEVDRCPRSWYVKLRHADGRKLAVRISDHGSESFKADGVRAWSVRVTRRLGLLSLLELVRRLVGMSPEPGPA